MTSDMHKFVAELQLPSDHELGHRLRMMELGHVGKPARSALSSGEKSAQVNAGSLTSFTERLEGQQKADVQNSTLLAQLASDKQYSRYTAPMDWYKFYIDVLGKIGWNQPAFAFDVYSSGEATVKLDSAVLGILAAIATNDEVALVAETMGALKGLSDDSKQMRIWSANSNSGNNGNFQIFPVDALQNGDVVMTLCGMQFDATTTQGRFLWWSWQSTSIKIQRAATKFVLNEQVYARVRQAILDKLGDRAAQFVADIEI